jgi:hypothetical protein
MDDVFGRPFAGRIYRGWAEEVIELKAGRHALEFEPTRILRRATLCLDDVSEARWRQVFEVASPPWLGQTMGYHPGSWKDGGTFVRA